MYVIRKKAMSKADSENYKVVPKGQVILKEGQVNTVAYMVKKGTVRLCKAINNRKVEVARIVPGQIFGEMPLVTGEPFFATAEAIEQCQLIPFDKPLIQALILKSPAPIQRIIRNMMEQLATLYDLVQAQSTDDLFISVCKILELLCSHVPSSPSSGPPKSAMQYAVRYSEFAAAVKDILVISQLEIDAVLEKLQLVNLIQSREIKGTGQKKDALGLLNTREYVKERILVITDKANFLSAARNLRREMLSKEEQLKTHGLEFLDIRDFAEAALTDTESVYRMLAKGRIPERLFFFPRRESVEWLSTLDEEFFEAIHGPGKYSELKIIDDIVSVDSSSLQQVLHKFDQEKIITLYAVAGENAKKKLLANLSEKMAQLVQQESPHVQVPYRTVAQYETEFFMLLRDICNQ